MSFTVRIKEEISMIKSNKSEAIAELSAYIRNNGDFQKNCIVSTTENKFVVDRITEMIQFHYSIQSKIEVIENLNFSKKDLYQLTIPKDHKMLIDLGIYDEQDHFLSTVPSYIVGGNEEIRGYLRGVFLGTGSINDPKTSRYHKE